MSNSWLTPRKLRTRSGLMVIGGQGYWIWQGGRSLMTTVARRRSGASAAGSEFAVEPPSH